ncbi:MAG: non-canonical purine NTP pyrophosphatase, partial [Actinomycetota bacterium]
MRVVFASTNAGKIREVREILGDRFDIWTPPMWLGDVETGETYLENATLKALAVHRMIGGAVLAEDSGLEVDALGGAPGIHSARFGRRRGTTFGQPGYEEGGKAKVLRLLEGVPANVRTARFRAVAVFVSGSGRIAVGEGVVEGSIADEPRGSGGFGY